MASLIAERKSLIQEFKEFLTTGDLVMIAVGLVMALYIKAIIDAIMEGVLLPIVSAIFGEEQFTEIGFDVGDARISIGRVIQAIFNFVVVGFLLFMIVRAYNQFKRTHPETAGPDEVQLLTEIRDELRRR